MQLYQVNQYHVSNLLSWIQEGVIAIPEIQRPFVWDTTKVRDLLDSLYNGYPIGYIITWRNPNVRLKDGTSSEGKKVLIDGQQRVTALMASIIGEKIVDNDYRRKRIKIAFNPITEKFETLTPAIQKDAQWIADISEILGKQNNLFEEVRKYKEKNPDVPQELIEKSISRLLDINNRQVGFIDLEADLDIDTVTEIFVRINSKGVVLSQADFAMSKIAAYDEYDNFGPNLRKAIDYFSHLSKAPHYFNILMETDKDFTNTVYFKKMEWLKNENDDLYDPNYSDILRVAFATEFERGKMSDLVGLLSGRNFETRKFEKEIMDETFQRLSNSVLDFINETNFQRFIMIIKATGFIDSSMSNSGSALNVAYAIFLKLRKLKMQSSEIEKWVQKWYIMSLLTGRYSASVESTIEADIKDITKKGIEKTLKDIEDSQLSEAFWNIELVQQLERFYINTPSLQVFFASQVKNNIKGFLSKDVTVANMIMHKGDIHHIFPKAYLKQKYKNKSDYNQIANYVYAQSEINIKIGNRAPKDYFEELKRQCDTGEPIHGRITNMDELRKNLEDHAIPLDIFDMTIDKYEDFLEKRRKLIAQKIEEYYSSLSGIDDELNNTNNYLQIIKNGEDNTTEFKAGLGWYIKEDRGEYSLEYAVVKTIDGFLNTNGGKLFIGVDDNGEIIGIEKDVNECGKKNHDSYLLRLNNLIASKLGKSAVHYIQINIIFLEERYVCVIDVLPSPTPVFVKDKNDKKFFVRTLAATEPLDIEESNEYIKKHWK